MGFGGRGFPNQRSDSRENFEILSEWSLSGPRRWECASRTPGLTYAAVGSLPAPEGCSLVVTDVALHDGGVLAGQVSDSNGVPQADVRVSLQDTQSQEVAAGVTDQQGAFRVQGVRPGVYQIVTPQARGFYRLGRALPRLRPSR